MYRALFFVPLFLIEITTLLLLRLSPMVRLTRATFFSFALMLGVFAVWARSGFGYPSAPLPTALNIASKILAFVTALTLFLPQRPVPEQAPPPDSSEQAQPASPPLALDSSAFAEIAAFFPFVLTVLGLEHGRVIDVAAFEQPSMFAAFGLPARL